MSEESPLVRIGTRVMHGYGVLRRAATEPSMTLSRGDLLDAGSAIAATVTGVELILNAAGCSLSGQEEIPNCDFGVQSDKKGKEDCTLLPNINDKIEAKNPGLISRLENDAQPFASILGQNSIKVYFHDIKATYGNPADSKDPAYINGHPDVSNGKLSVHMWLNTIFELPPEISMRSLVNHESTHGLDELISAKAGIVTISPPIPQGLHMGDSEVRSVVQEGAYNTETGTFWSKIIQQQGHPWDSPMEALASSVVVMRVFSDEMFQRLQWLLQKNPQQAKLLAGYYISVLDTLQTYIGENVLDVMGFDPKLKTNLLVIAQ